MPRIRGARRRCNKCRELIVRCKCNESIVRAIKSRGEKCQE